MEIITAEDIYNSKDYQKSLELSEKVKKEMKGPSYHNYIHLVYAIRQLMGPHCKTYLEIGSYHGHSLSLLLHSEYETTYLCADLFETEEKINNVQNNITHFTNGEKRDVRLFKGKSQDPKMVEAIRETLKTLSEESSRVDLLFIDGDHRKDAIITDFELYSPFVREGGIIVFDDYLPHVFRGVVRGAPSAIDHIVQKYGEDYNVIGLLENRANCKPDKDASYLGENKKNIEFVMQKKYVK